MYSNLDATNFSGSIPFYDITFEDMLSKVTICYYKMIENKEVLINDENKKLLTSDIANAVEHIFNMRKGAVISEYTIRSISFGITKKKS